MRASESAGRQSTSFRPARLGKAGRPGAVKLMIVVVCLELARASNKREEALQALPGIADHPANLPCEHRLA